MTKFDAIGFGALNLDKLFKVNKIAGKDEESFVVKTHESSGGSAANTIVGLARLGLKTGFIGKVTNDHAGRFMLSDLEKENVNTKGVLVESKGQTGVVMGFVDGTGERALYVAPGVNDTIDLNEINKSYARETKFLHLSSFVGKKPLEAQEKLLGGLPDDVKVSLDPGMLYAKRGISLLKPILNRVFATFLNETEMKLLTGRNYERGAMKLLTMGVKVIAVKLGGEGCFVTDGTERHFIRPFNTNVVDTTGAGDAWNAGFLYGLLKNKTLCESGTLGNFMASRCVMKMGARVGLPTYMEFHQSGIIPSD